MFRHDNNDVLARQQRCFGMTTTMFWHDNNDVFKDNRDNRDNL